MTVNSLQEHIDGVIGLCDQMDCVIRASFCLSSVSCPEDLTHTENEGVDVHLVDHKCMASGLHVAWWATHCRVFKEHTYLVGAEIMLLISNPWVEDRGNAVDC